MKKYLVAYTVGLITKSTIIEVANDYIPASDDMKTIKEKIIKKDRPNYIKIYSSPDSCGGYINTIDSNYPVSEDDLIVIAISNLEI